VQTRWLDSRPVKNDLKGPAFDFGVLKKKKVVVFLGLPPRRLATHATWLRVGITSGVQALMDDVTKTEIPCLIALDEFFAIADGGFEIITKNMAMMRKYSIKLLTVFQDLSQAQKLLGRDGFETFFANAGLVQSFATQDGVTSDYLSKLTGTTTRQALSLTGSRSHTPGSLPNRSDSSSLSQIAMPLMLPQEIRELPEDQTLVFSHMLTNRQGIYRVPYPPEDMPELSDVMSRDPTS
jgi:type IV secretion system protein VirD4